MNQKKIMNFRFSIRNIEDSIVHVKLV